MGWIIFIAIVLLFVNSIDDNDIAIGCSIFALFLAGSAIFEAYKWSADNPQWAAKGAFLVLIALTSFVGVKRYWTNARQRKMILGSVFWHKSFDSYRESFPWDELSRCVGSLASPPKSAQKLPRFVAKKYRKIINGADLRKNLEDPLRTYFQRVDRNSIWSLPLARIGRLRGAEPLAILLRTINSSRANKAGFQDPVGLFCRDIFAMANALVVIQLIREIDLESQDGFEASLQKLTKAKRLVEHLKDLELREMLDALVTEMHELRRVLREEVPRVLVSIQKGDRAGAEAHYFHSVESWCQSAPGLVPSYAAMFHS